MKKSLLFIATALMLLASCKEDYHNKVENTLQSSVYAQGCLTCVVTHGASAGLEADSLLVDSISKGYVDIFEISTEQTIWGPIATYNFSHPKLLIKKTPYQDWEDFWHTAWRVVLAIVSVIIFLVFAVIFIITTSKGAGLQYLTLLIPCAIALACFGAAVYPWSDEGYITKAEYDANQVRDGDQRSIDWNNIKSL